MNLRAVDKKFRSKHKHKSAKDMVNTSQMIRRAAGMYGRREHMAALNTRGDEHVSASMRQEKIREQCGMNVLLLNP